jgi:LmbE family N-acetylglucosaminyl deacetylase
MNILAIGSHPDDIELGCGGALSRYSGAGHNVYLFVLTTGTSGGDAEVREAEQGKAAEILEAKELFVGDYEDTKIPVDKSLITRIENLLNQVRPEIVFIHYG